MMEQVDHNRKGSRETDDIRENAEDISPRTLQDVVTLCFCTSLAVPWLFLGVQALSP